MYIPTMFAMAVERVADVAQQKILTTDLYAEKLPWHVPQEVGESFNGLHNLASFH